MENVQNNREYRQTFDRHARELLSSLTLEEKVSLMSGEVDLQQVLKEKNENPEAHYNHVPYPAGGIDKINLPPILFCDGSRGVVCGTGKSTCFPVSMLRGASFDRELEKKIGEAIGKEITAYGGNLFGGVCINLPYHPGWGRSQETYGEESYHLGEMGKAFLTGVQNENIMACVKHFAFNQMEISRFQVNIECDKRTEREVFLPHFKKCIDAGAAAVMSSYNKYKGIHCGHHEYLLNQVLKKEWKFDGFVMSDFGWGVRETEAAAHGQDIEMCGTVYFGDKLIQAVREGRISEKCIDESALRIIRTILSFQGVDTQKNDMSILACEEHRQLALRVAQEGITLIRNRNNVLPLCRKKTKKILVLGRLGNKDNLGDHGSSRVIPPYVVTPVQGILELAGEGTSVTFIDGSNLEQAVLVAKESDAVIFIAGYESDDEGEFMSERAADNFTGARGGDRDNKLGLLERDLKLIRKIGPLSRKSVVVLIGGSMIMLEDWKEYIDAILMAYYPGMEGGKAIAQILFGDVNPSGKMPYVTPKREEDLPLIDWHAKTQFYQYYHGYAKLEKEGKLAAIPYGYGLSYTSFQLTEHEFSTDGQCIEVSCKVKNIGGCEGAEVVQLYVGFENSMVDRPIKLLRGFQRIHLVPGEERKVTIRCPYEELTWYNPKTEKMELELMEYQVYIGTSSDNRDLYKGTVSILCQDIVSDRVAG